MFMGAHVWYDGLGMRQRHGSRQYGVDYLLDTGSRWAPQHLHCFVLEGYIA